MFVAFFFFKQCLKNISKCLIYFTNQNYHVYYLFCIFDQKHHYTNKTSTHQVNLILKPAVADAVSTRKDTLGLHQKNKNKTKTSETICRFPLFHSYINVLKTGTYFSAKKEFWANRIANFLKLLFS